MFKKYYKNNNFITKKFLNTQIYSFTKPVRFYEMNETIYDHYVEKEYLALFCFIKDENKVLVNWIILLGIGEILSFIGWVYFFNA